MARLLSLGKLHKAVTYMQTFDPNAYANLCKLLKKCQRKPSEIKSDPKDARIAELEVHVEDLTTKLDALQGIKEALNADSIRLNWLEKQCIVELSKHAGQDEWTINSIQFEDWRNTRPVKGDLRRAIDARIF